MTNDKPNIKPGDLVQMTCAGVGKGMCERTPTGYLPLGTVIKVRPTRYGRTYNGCQIVHTDKFCAATCPKVYFHNLALLQRAKKQ